jgi:alkylation response protein AidB-like acyl-CoA dehydrogenase
VRLELSEDEEDIRGVFAAFFTNEAGPAVARAAEPLGFDPVLWKKLVAIGAPDMGTAAGGNASMAALAIVAGEMGRSIAPVPLIEHQVAVRVQPADVVCAFAPRPAVDGVARLVPGGAVAEVVVALDGDELVAVTSTAPGSAPPNYGSAPIADRDLRVGQRTVIASGEKAWHRHQRALMEWQVLTAAALVGVGDAALDMARAYVMERHQFGVPIGSFQAVQHGLADLPGMLIGARLLVARAAWAADALDASEGAALIDVRHNEYSDPGVLAAMALLFAGDTAKLATARSLHYHGGFGYSEEFDIQLYYRRARAWGLVAGDPAAHVAYLAQRLIEST